jgi:hypothetical protein
MELRALTGSLALCGALAETTRARLRPLRNLVVGQLRGSHHGPHRGRTHAFARRTCGWAAGLGGELSLGRHVWLVASAMLELALTRTSFSVSQGGVPLGDPPAALGGRGGSSWG